jgi:hypothetical protein
VDYVNLEYPRDTFDVSWALMGNRTIDKNTPYTMPAPTVPDEDEWVTNHWQSGNPGNQSISDTDPTFGIINQVCVCKGLTGPDPIQGWKNYAIDPQFHGDTAAAIQFFNFQFGLGASDGTYTRSNTFYSPFSPIGVVNFNISWQANDPLVHYTVGDLNDGFGIVSNLEVLHVTSPSPFVDLGGSQPLNPHYRPWFGNPNSKTDVPSTKNNLAVKDPGMSRSDYWDFPTGKLPNPGWLGRVHRGTPWQTVYFKSLSPSSLDFQTWTNWLGSGQWVTNMGQISTSIVRITNLVNDAIFSYPTNDWALLNLFTAGMNANSTRGQMSVNQTNLAAWSATLAGVNVLTNTSTISYGNLFIPPVGGYDATKPASWPPLLRIVNGIIQSRTNFQGNYYHQVGDILATPELTVNSPFINTNTAQAPAQALNDEVYERIPQQILGLLRCDTSPRFVIYAFGQTLKPAEHSLETSGSFFGLCTNYQVTAEAATRAVVRIDGAPSKPRVVIESYTPLPPD